jgi:hypothetical protein
MHVVVPVVLLGPLHGLATTLVMMAVGAYYMEGIFIVNHLQADLVPTPGAHWAVQQVQASANWGSGARWTNWISGGLNHQLEHHLFPSMSIYLYPTISPVVRATCAEFGLVYRDCGGYAAALARCVAHLHDLGRQPSRASTEAAPVAEPALEAAGAGARAGRIVAACAPPSSSPSPAGPAPATRHRPSRCRPTAPRPSSTSGSGSIARRPRRPIASSSRCSIAPAAACCSGRTVWKGDFELFFYEADDGELEFHLPGSGASARARAYTSIDHPPTGPREYRRPGRRRRRARRSTGDAICPGRRTVNRGRMSLRPWLLASCSADDRRRRRRRGGRY